MRDLYLSCLASLISWSLFKHAVHRILLWYAMRKVDPAALAAIPALASLRDEDCFRDGWRACERCHELKPTPDDEHIMHHFSYDGHPREKERCNESA